MQRASGGDADFIDAGADRGFDVLTTSGTGVSLPLTPGRNHRALATSKITTIFVKNIQPKGIFALQSEYLTARNHWLKSIPSHVIVVTADGHRCSASSTGDCREVLQFCVVSQSAQNRPTPDHADCPCPSRDRDIGGKPPLVLAGSRNREEDQITP
jgi:hypothetical protein